MPDSPPEPPVDLRTLFIAQTALLLAMAAMLWLARTGADRRNGLGAWTLAVTCQAAAFLLLAQAGRLPAPLTGPLANALGAASVALFHVAIRRFLGTPAPAGWLWVMVGAVIGVALVAGERYWVSTMFNGFAFGLVQLLNARALWRPQRAELQRVQRCVAAAYLAMGLLLPTRAALLLANALELDYLHQPLALQEPIYLFGFLFIVVTNIGFVQMCKMRAEAEVRHQAMTDELTGLPNRRAFQLALAHEIAAARRAARPFAIVVVDVDHFKSINDRFGHSGGDTALVGFAHGLLQGLRAQDQCFRIGGEEFCALLGGEDLHGAGRLAERLRHRVAQPAAGDQPAITASFGVAVWNGEEDADALLQRADRALYRAKAEGRDRVAVDAGQVFAPA